MLNSVFIFDELGRKRARLREHSYKFYGQPKSLITSLSPGCGNNSVNSSTNTLIFLGIGTNIEEMLSLATLYSQIYEHIYYVECLEILAQSPVLPIHWQKLTSETFLEQLPKFLTTATILVHKQNSQLFSNFWLTILAKLELATLPCIKQVVPQVIIPGNVHDLLTHELLLACQQLQLSATLMDVTSVKDLYPYIMSSNLPQLYLSINLRGLDAEGKNFNLLKAAKVPVAIWFVDNPWHSLSSLIQPWWHEAVIFVSDASFIADLKAHGANKVYFLPLGSWMTKQTQAGSTQTQADLPLALITFVGRSSFPDRNKFFAGLKFEAPPPEQLVPSVHYWQSSYNIEKCWPGKAYRQAGFAAEQCSLLKRLTWLKAALNYGLTVFGDQDWQTLLPNLSDLRQPIDYYSKLGHIYRQANFTLNITSYLLPAGLTQRHFDVFSSGGFLLTDYTPGLDIFPKKLTKFITLASPQDLGKYIKCFQDSSHFKKDLALAWQDELKLKHSYKIRLETIINITQY